MTPTFSPAIPLDQPITRGEQTITDLKVRKPGAGELRGLKLTDVLQLDVTALATLLPRISSPTLTTADVNAMDPADLLAVGQEVQVFLAQGTEGSGLPDCVEDAMADIAAIFHWPPSEMDGWSLHELTAWRERARLRSGAE